MYQAGCNQKEIEVRSGLEFKNGKGLMTVRNTIL